MEHKAENILHEPLWVKDFILITLVNLFTFLGFQMLMPTLPVYAKSLGGGNTSAGLVVGFFTFSALLIRPFAGHALDIYGRKAVLFLGLIVFASCVISYTWAVSLFILLAIRFVHGFGWGLTSTASSTVASDIVPRARMGEGMGYYGMSATISMALAPALGLHIIGKYNFDVLFRISFSMLIIAIFLSSLIKYKKSNGTGQKLKLVEKNALRPALTIFFVTMTYGAIVSFIALYAAQKGIVNIGIFFTVYALSLAVFRPLSGRLTDMKGFDFVVIPGIIMVGLAMIILFFAESLKWFLFAAVIYGAGFGTVQPSLQALAILISPPERRGSANATFFSGFDLGIGSSAVMWGIVSEFTGYSLMYLLSVIPVLLALFIYIYLGKREVKARNIL